MTEDDGTSLLLTPAQTAKMLNICRGTLLRFAEQGWGPAAVDLTAPGRQKRILRWKRDEVLSFIESSKARKGAA